jgi:hypothetical protein
MNPQLDQHAAKDLRLESLLFFLLPAVAWPATRHRSRTGATGLELAVVASFGAQSHHWHVGGPTRLSPPERGIPLETQAFQFLDTGKSHT